MSHSGQAALEFLMTYGWAILAVLVVISALAYFGVLNPSNLVPDHCTLSAGFGCPDIVVGSDGAEILVQNKLPQSYVITAASITGTGISCAANASAVLASGDTAAVKIPGCNLTGIVGKKRIGINITYHDAGSSFSHQLLGEAVTSVTRNSYFGPGYALNFIGSDWVNTTVIQPQGAITLAAWVKLNSQSTWARIIGTGLSVNPWDSYQLTLVGATRTVGFYLTHSANGGLGGDYAVVTSTTALNLGQWYFIAGTWNGSVMTIYVDGVPEASTAYAGPIYYENRSLKMGVGGGGYLGGALDEVQIYGRALSPQEIAGEYNNGTGTPNGPTTGLLGGWHLDDGPGSATAQDYSGYGNTGVLMGMNTNTSWVTGIVQKP